MPTYSFINTETNEKFDEFFKSWKDKDVFLEENTHIKQAATPIHLKYNNAGKPDEGFRDILREIKKANPRGDVNTF